MDCKILAWNCRGAGSRNFLPVFREYRRKFRPHIVIIVEPRISGDRALDVIRDMGYDSSHVVDAHGFSGGIWVLWNACDFVITRMNSHPQCLHVQVHDPISNGQNWCLSAIYGSPAEVQRRDLWEEIRRINEDMALPWMLVRDFNAIISPSENLGGAPFDSSRIRDFQDVVQDTGLNDLGFNGPAYTWFRIGLRERLDRGMANNGWLEEFPETTVRHVPRMKKSDHRPLFVSMRNEASTGGAKSFRFLAAWLTHEGFRAMADAAWAKGSSFTDSAAAFAWDATNWNRRVFGHILRKKEDLLRRIERLENAGGGDGANEQLAQVQEELEMILFQEELLWYQKSRLDW
ncbi:unnamed protein product [Linum trigynum]|uniref:Endonuclease/exonuclease/phosphatase domain-containing protein n=1 Tax=Linum trigynum TaxID=586398 RepID=A0AAV2FYV3_9ROSI